MLSGTPAPAGDLGANAAIGEFFRQLLFNLFNPSARSRGQSLQPFAQDLVALRIELAKREILQLLAHLLHAHTAGKRRINLKRLIGSAPARVGRVRRPAAPEDSDRGV